MEGSLETPIVISDDENLPDAPPLSLSTAVSPDHRSASPDPSESHDQSHDQVQHTSSSSGENANPTDFKLRGRKRGDGAGTKRKREESLSNNPHSKKARERKSQMNAVEQEIERAKNADRQAKKRARAKIEQDPVYLAKDLLGRDLMMSNAMDKLMDKRYTLGRSGLSVAARLGYGDEGGLFANYDDGNEAWEDMEEDVSDPFFEKRVQANDVENDERIPTDEDLIEAKDNATLQQEKAATLAHIGFKHWARFWRGKLNKFSTQLVQLERLGDTENWVKWYYDLSTNRIYEIEPPHMFFDDPAVRALFRNMGAWMKDESDMPKDTISADSDIDCDKAGDWYTLPGPAEWWPENYDFKKFGFDIEAGDGKKFETAFNIMFEDTQPEAYKWILPGMEELMVIGQSREAEVLLQFFG